MLSRNSGIRNEAWKDDFQLKASMEKHVREGLQRGEVLNYLMRDFPYYARSLRTMDITPSYKIMT